ncbi:hypothetical protein [Microcystis sp. LE19-8.1F]|uniref:hypothetical protein n=1 Tax=Microcystis sp. LE19-8.1F TaxID=3016437 RepID=UPI00258FDB3E|nr:hypothetical protein [Microcystis sp. LE19-8.1F]
MVHGVGCGVWGVGCGPPTPPTSGVWGVGRINRNNLLPFASCLLPFADRRPTTDDRSRVTDH